MNTHKREKENIKKELNKVFLIRARNQQEPQVNVYSAKLEGFQKHGGIRLKLNQLEFNPRGRLPDQGTKFIFHDIKYQGFVLDLIVDNNTYEIFVSAHSNIDYIPLVYEHGEHRGSLKVNDRLSFPIDTRLIIRRSITLCP